MRAVFVALILKFHSVTSEKRVFRPERAGVDKIRVADLLKIHLGVELDPKLENLPVNEKQLLFARA